LIAVTTFARTSGPFVKPQTLRQLARAAQKSDAIHEKRLRTEAHFYDLAGRTPAAQMMTAPAIGTQRRLIEALSIEDSIAKAELDAHAHSIRTEILMQLRNGSGVA
jgi:hypothetical protein